MLGKPQGFLLHLLSMTQMKKLPRYRYCLFWARYTRAILACYKLPIIWVKPPLSWEQPQVLQRPCSAALDVEQRHGVPVQVAGSHSPLRILSRVPGPSHTSEPVQHVLERVVPVEPPADPPPRPGVSSDSPPRITVASAPLPSGGGDTSTEIGANKRLS